jgi:hypothetical protein
VSKLIDRNNACVKKKNEKVTITNIFITLNSCANTDPSCITGGTRCHEGTSPYILNLQFNGLVLIDVCLQPPEQFFFTYLAPVTITGDRAENLDLWLRLSALKVHLRATPAATNDLRF